MAGRRPQRPGAVDSLSIPPTGNTPTDRAFKRVEQAVQKVQAVASRAVVLMDLAIGRNVIRHGLGRSPLGYTLTPTVASAAFAHAIAADNPNAELELWIDVIGAAQPGARLEVW
jgi:hypothetical protein